MGCNCNNSESFTFNSDNNDIKIISSGIHSIRVENDIVHTPLVIAEIQNERLELCRTCSFCKIVLNKEKCTYGTGGFLRAKTSLTDQQCPNTENKLW